MGIVTPKSGDQEKEEGDQGRVDVGVGKTCVEYIIYSSGYG